MARYLGGREADVRLFPPFRFDVRDERLWKGTEELKVRRKPFAILKDLTANPRHLVTQKELVEAVWGKIAMSESLLRTHVSELRRLLGDGVIETVVGRGYRFLLDVQVEKQVVSPSKAVEVRALAADLIGRSKEMDALRQVFETVLNQKRQIVIVGRIRRVLAICGSLPLPDEPEQTSPRPCQAPAAQGASGPRLKSSPQIALQIDALALDLFPPARGRTLLRERRRAPTLLLGSGSRQTALPASYRSISSGGRCVRSLHRR